MCIRDRRIDASRCISRRTIERGEGDEGELHGWIFGCDLCQRACPHNRRAPIASNKAFRPVPELERMNAEQWLALNLSLIHISIPGKSSSSLPRSKRLR